MYRNPTMYGVVVGVGVVVVVRVVRLVGGIWFLRGWRVVSLESWGRFKNEPFFRRKVCTIRFLVILSTIRNLTSECRGFGWGYRHSFVVRSHSLRS